MDILSQITQKIALLRCGEQCVISAEELLIGRDDFHSLTVYLNRTSEQGGFSVVGNRAVPQSSASTSVKIIKN